MKTALDQLKFRINKYLRKHEPLILCYHSIHNNEVAFPIWTHLDYKFFEQHLKFISDNFKCISLSKLSEQLTKRDFDPYTIVITFDDGYRNNFTNAFPLLVKYRFPATIFVTTDFIGTTRYIWSDNLAAMLTVSRKESVSFDKTHCLLLTTPQERALAYRLIVNDLKHHPPDQIGERLNKLMNQLGVSEDDLKTPALQSCFGHLSWGQISEMLNSGLIEIGSHGMSHSILSLCSENAARKEIEMSKVILDSNLSNCQPVSCFAYPNGGPTDYSQDTQIALIEAGYNLVLTTKPNRVCRTSDRYQMPRKCIGNECDLIAFRYLSCH